MDYRDTNYSFMRFQACPVPSSSWTASTNKPQCTNLILQMTLGFKFQPFCGWWRVWFFFLNALTTACCTKVSRIWRIQFSTMLRGWHWKLNTERNPTLFCFLPSLCKRFLSFLYRRSCLPRGRFLPELLWTEIRNTLIQSSKECKGDSTSVLNWTPCYEGMLGRRWS